MKYITIKRFKRNNPFGNFNIPYGTPIEEVNGWLLAPNGARICRDTAALMREYFARDDDGNGLERGKVAHAIIDRMHIEPNETKDHWQERWNVIWEDKMCQKYKKDESETTFLWSIDFYNAPLFDLYYIARLVGANIKEDK